MGKEAIPAILERIALTGNLRNSCSEEGVKHPTFLLWVSQDEELADQYARARSLGCDAMAEDILLIADDNGKDTYVSEDGVEQTDHDVIARARLRVDTRKWLLSKLHPKKYGDKMDLNATITERIQVVDDIPPTK